jgi:hypothetical protein
MNRTTLLNLRPLFSEWGKELMQRLVRSSRRAARLHWPATELQVRGLTKIVGNQDFGCREGDILKPRDLSVPKLEREQSGH